MLNTDIINQIYKDYTQTVIVKEKDGTETHMSPPGHYSNETKEQVVNKILTNPEFAKSLGATVYTKQTDSNIIIGIVYKNNVLEFIK